ncbi:putative pentatricopeptide repeat-containing protein-like [Capsicum annuum]|nr:putative pentatricopeptide repeat-containing protein-like [Capsicum annuum]
MQQNSCEILALKSGSWRIIGKPTGIYSSWLSNMNSLAFVHGAFHWLGLSRNESVTSYDISNGGHELRQTWPFGFQMVKCYSVDSILTVVVIYLRQPKNHLVFGLNLVQNVFGMDLFIYRKLDLSKITYVVFTHVRSRQHLFKNSEKSWKTELTYVAKYKIVSYVWLGVIVQPDEMCKISLLRGLVKSISTYIFAVVGLAYRLAPQCEIEHPKCSNGMGEGHWFKPWKRPLAEMQGKRVVKRSKNMDVDGTMEVRLQEEIIMDILSRLPVLSLLRFKCVSKYWMTLISEPYFTLKHLNHAKNNQSSQKILVLHVSSVRTSHTFAMEPSTRESIVLPRTEFSLTKDYSCGVGYDSTSDNYKILMIDNAAHCEILALKSGSWRKIDKRPSGVSPVLSDTEDSGAFVHGAFHWLDSLLKNSLISFRISNEVYGEIPLPEGMSLVFNVNCINGVSALEGMLCVYSTHIRRGIHTFKLWILKDYDVKESWN